MGMRKNEKIGNYKNNRKICINILNIVFAGCLSIHFSTSKNSK